MIFVIVVPWQWKLSDLRIKRVVRLYGRQTPDPPKLLNGIEIFLDKLTKVISIVLPSNYF